MSTITCPQCSTRLPSNVVTCPRCRTRLGQAASPLPTAHPSPLPPVISRKKLSPPPAPAAPGQGTAVRGQVPVKSRAVLATLVCAVALAALSLLKSGEMVAGFAARHTEVDTELSLVESTVAEFSQQAVPSSHPDTEWVAGLGQQLVDALPAGSPYKAHYRFQLIDSDEVNAFALPGGAIFVHSGLLTQLERRPDLVAAVLAHEIQHVERRHGLHSIYQAMTVAALTLWTFGLSSDFGLTLSDTLINTRHSRKLEREADEKALELLRAAGQDPAAMPEALIRIATTRQGWQAPAWISTHPDPEDRAKSLEQRLEKGM